MGAAGPWGGSPSKSSELLLKIAKLQQYSELIGWNLEEIHINADDVINDDKIGILKIAPIGEVVHEVGMRASEEEFYVMRQPKF